MALGALAVEVVAGRDIRGGPPIVIAAARQDERDCENA
jgi:hypothetical protein